MYWPRHINLPLLVLVELLTVIGVLEGRGYPENKVYSDRVPYNWKYPKIELDFKVTQ